MKPYLTLLLLFISSSLLCQQILLEEERAQVIDEILNERFELLLPELMDQSEIAKNLSTVCFSNQLIQFLKRI